MSGVEFIVGTVLAGIPIVLEAYDRYWDLSEGFGTFRRYSDELKKLDTILKTQKTIFRNNVIKLLTELTKDQEKAQNLLSDSSKDRWKELKLPPAFDSNRIYSLRDTFESWVATLDIILSSIRTICHEVESFRSTAAPSGSLLSREMLKQLPKRFRLCWKKNEVQDSIKELREFTSDFDKLTVRIVDELKNAQGNSPQTLEAAMCRRLSQLNSLEKYRQVRSASCKLYNAFALRWSCSAHRKHAASISFVDDSKLMNSKTIKDGIKFDVAIDCLAGSSTRLKMPIWLEVETVSAGGPVVSVYESEESEAKTDNDWTSTVEKIGNSSLPMVIEYAGRVHKKLVKRSMRFQPLDGALASGAGGFTPVAVVQATATGDDSEATTEAASDASTASMTDLETIGDLCRHFQIPRPIGSNTCVGYIKDLGIHRFYLPPSELRPSGQQKSLAEIISWISEDELSRSLDRVDVVHLASSLAAAILQYHSTPWLPQTWKSNQIHFFGTGDFSRDANNTLFMTPYFRVEFSQPTSATGPASTPSRRTASMVVSTGDAPMPTPAALARNELLFHFGIVLLELGYSQPWPELQQRAFRTLPPQQHTDYHAADKLAQTPFLRNRVGPKFPTIVRKCLGCDFGLGENDLANEELQGTFLVDVVVALREVTNALRGLERRLET